MCSPDQLFNVTRSYLYSLVLSIHTLWAPTSVDVIAVHSSKYKSALYTFSKNASVVGGLETSAGICATPGLPILRECFSS